MSLNNSQYLSASTNALAFVVLLEWHIIRACNALSEKLVCVQDLHWRKQNEHQKNSKEAYHLEKQLKLQLDNALLVYSDFLQRIDSQIDDIFVLCQRRKWMYKCAQLNDKGRETDKLTHLCTWYCSKLAFKCWKRGRNAVLLPNVRRKHTWVWLPLA